MKRIPWFQPDFDNEEIIQASKVIKTNYLNEGDVVSKFEKIVSKLLNIKYCIACTSGTSAISLALMALDVEAKDEVIVPNFTFIATANAAKMLGAKVKLVDVDKKTLNIDPIKIKEAITDKTKCLVTVDVNGRACQYKEILKICKEHKVKLITDSAEAFYSNFKNKKLGTIGDIGCFSFSAMKTISTGQGGMLATNSKKLYLKLKKLKDQGRQERGTGGDDIHNHLGFNFKYTNLQASIGIAQLKKLKSRVRKFKMRDNKYTELLSPNKNIFIPPKEKKEVLQWFDILSDDIEKIKDKLRRNNIDFRSFWLPLNTQITYKESSINYANSHSISKKGIWLPSYFGITTNEIEFVCKKIHEVFE